MQWKIIPGFEKYKVSDTGLIWSEYKQDYLTPSANKKDGYVRVSLRKDKKGHTLLLHRLVMLSFVGNPNKRHVNHKNNTKTDNRLCNLEYVTPSENMLHRTYNDTKNPLMQEVMRLHKQGKSYSKIANTLNISKGTVKNIIGVKNNIKRKKKSFNRHLLPNEIVKPIPDNDGYFASNFGRIFSTKSGNVMTLQDKPNGYIAIDLHSQGKHYREYVHRLVLSAFCGRPNQRVVNHINGDVSDNRLCNLEWVTQSENLIKWHKSRK